MDFLTRQLNIENCSVTILPVSCQIELAEPYPKELMNQLQMGMGLHNILLNMAAKGEDISPILAAIQEMAE